MIEKPGLKTDPFMEWVYEKAQGVMIELDQAPTSTTPLIGEKDWGYFNNKIYFVIGGVLKEIAVSSTA